MAYPKTILSDEQIEAVRYRALKAIAPLRPPDESAHIPRGTRTNAGRNLPPHYLVYFLLVELLKFGHGGRWEKVAWTIPVDYDGHLALVEHRKMGLGIFSPANPQDELAAQGIVKAIQNGIKVARPFFDHLAAKAVEESRLNVHNSSAWLFNRYEYLRDEFRRKVRSAKRKKNDIKKKEEVLPDGTTITSYSVPSIAARQQATWLGIAAIDAFFSWTEHVMIHIGILNGRIKTGDEVAMLASADWSDKVKSAIGLDNPTIKSLFDELLSVRRQIRNYIAHGAFGKDGKAFTFHSGAGAVPINLTDPEGRDNLSIWSKPQFDEAAALETTESFIKKLWEGDLAPARIYLQEELPVILTFASDGTYKRAMKSTKAMKSFADALMNDLDNARNMDW
jgi:hypothetical protein